MKNAQKFWDKTAPRYAKSRISDEKSYQRKLVITQEYFRPNWSVLEFGCGTGSTAIIHAPYVKDILATDISEKMLEIADQKARNAGMENIRFQQGTLDSLELEAESFDAVLGLNILHLLDDVEAAISRTHALLKPGGIFVSSSALITNMGLHWRLLIPIAQFVGMAPSVNSFSKPELVSMLERNGFSIEYQWQPRKESLFIVARKAGN